MSDDAGDDASELWSSIYDVLVDSCLPIATDRNGSMVLRLCYDLVDLPRKKAIAQVVVENALELSVDSVGNYVVQHVLTIPEE